jgi:hypothetical protein
LNLSREELKTPDWSSPAFEMLVTRNSIRELSPVSESGPTPMSDWILLLEN